MDQVVKDEEKEEDEEEEEGGASSVSAGLLAGGGGEASLWRSSGIISYHETTIGCIDLELPHLRLHVF